MALDLPHRLGPFELLRHLASGGMGDVYLAHEPAAATERLCVVKTVRPEYAHDKAALRRFVDEARTSALLSHDNVVTVLDVGEADGTAYIAVEYIAGRDLMNVMARASRARRPLPEAVALFLITELLDALDYVHRATDPRSGAELHVVHRDISPHNVLVSFEGQVKLIDFGIARTAIRSELTHVGQLVGKVRYMSPEQARGEPVGGATDVWAACVVACELLTGRRFWGERSPEQVAPMLAAGAPHRPPTFASLPAELQPLLSRGLDLDATVRPAAGELRDAIRAVQKRRNTLGSRAEVAAWMEGLFAGEREAERVARGLLLREPTIANAAAWPADTAFEEHSNVDDDVEGDGHTASRSGAVTRSMTPVARLDDTHDQRRGAPVARGRSAARPTRPRTAVVVAAVATPLAVLGFALAFSAAPPRALPSGPLPRPVDLLPVEPTPVRPAPVVEPVAEPVAEPPAEPLPVAAAPPVEPAPIAAAPMEPAPVAAAPPAERRTARRTNRPAPMPLLFSDRVDALQDCSPRPPCAASVLRRSEEVAELAVEELRDLDDALARCLARCAR